jgi:hypothetical protein
MDLYIFLSILTVIGVFAYGGWQKRAYKQRKEMMRILRSINGNLIALKPKDITDMVIGDALKKLDDYEAAVARGE